MNMLEEIGMISSDIERLSRQNADSDHSLATLERSGPSALLISDAEHIPYNILWLALGGPLWERAGTESSGLYAHPGKSQCIGKGELEIE